MIALTPLPGHVLVELREKYTHTLTTAEKYDTRTSGICLEMHLSTKDRTARTRDPYEKTLNKLVFWEEYKTGTIIEREGKEYAFIKIEDLTGYENA
jgi:co-chaperonin GroES (HSP10)